MLHSSKLLVLTLALFLAGRPAIAFEDASISFHGKKTGNVYIFDFRTNKLKKIWEGGGIGFTTFGPNGKTVAFSKGSSVFIVNIDGSGVNEYRPSNWPPDGSDWGQLWDYASSGIFWVRGSGMYRFDPATKKTTKLSVSGPMGDRMAISADGRKGYSSRRIFIKISADFKSAKTWDTGTKGCLSGHGNCITGFGGYVCYASFSAKFDGGCGQHSLGVATFNDQLFGSSKKSDCSYPGKYCIKLGNAYDGDPLPPTHCCGIANWGGPRQVVNSDDWIIYMAGAQVQSTHVVRWAFVNHKTKEIKPLPVIENNLELNQSLRYGEAWIGPLSKAAGAQIALDIRELTFTGGDQAPAPQKVVVSSTGTKPAGEITVSVEASAAQWLTAETKSDGSNKVEITNTVNPSGVADGQHKATVTVSAANVSGKLTYTVTYIKGGIVPPTDVNAEIVGTDMLDVKLSWKDASSDEAGYSVERKDSKNSWKEITRTAANSTSYVDKGLPHEDYTYRLRAFKADTYSAYSEEAKIRVQGAKSITIGSPGEGHILKAGATIAVTWTANIVTNVEILYSVDEGLAWTPITALGGIDRHDSDWGNFIWKVPDIDEPDVLIQIRDYAMHEIFANAGPFAISSTIDKSEIARLNVPALSKTVRFGRHADGSIELEIREYGHYAAKFFNTRGAVLAELHGNGPASRFIAPRFSTGTIIVQVKTGSGMYRRNILLP